MLAKCSDWIAIGNKPISFYVHSLGFNCYFLSEEKKADLLKPPLRRFLFREYAITHIETRF